MTIYKTTFWKPIRYSEQELQTYFKSSFHQDYKDYLPCDKEPSNFTEVWRRSHICFNMWHSIAAARCVSRPFASDRKDPLPVRKYKPVIILVLRNFNKSKIL